MVCVCKCGFDMDIQKVHNAVHLDKSHWCYQMYLWNNDLNIEQTQLENHQNP